MGADAAADVRPPKKLLAELLLESERPPAAPAHASDHAGQEEPPPPTPKSQQLCHSLRLASPQLARSPMPMSPSTSWAPRRGSLVSSRSLFSHAAPSQGGMARAGSYVTMSDRVSPSRLLQAADAMLAEERARSFELVELSARLQADAEEARAERRSLKESMLAHLEAEKEERTELLSRLAQAEERSASLERERQAERERESSVRDELTATVNRLAERSVAAANSAAEAQQVRAELKSERDTLAAVRAELVQREADLRASEARRARRLVRRPQGAAGEVRRPRGAAQDQEWRRRGGARAGAALERGDRCRQDGARQLPAAGGVRFPPDVERVSLCA